MASSFQSSSGRLRRWSSGVREEGDIDINFIMAMDEEEEWWDHRSMVMDREEEGAAVVSSILMSSVMMASGPSPARSQAGQTVLLSGASCTKLKRVMGTKGAFVLKGFYRGM